MSEVCYLGLFDAQLSKQKDHGCNSAEALLQLLKDARQLCQTSAYGSPTFLADINNYLLPSINKCRSGLIAAVQDKMVLGVLLFRIVVDECEIEHVTVREQDRRRGLGAGLLRQFEKLAQNQGVKKVFLEVGVKNIGAHTLYSKFGFLPISTRPLYYRNSEDAIVMEKKI